MTDIPDSPDKPKLPKYSQSEITEHIKQARRELDMGYISEAHAYLTDVLKMLKANEAA